MAKVIDDDRQNWDDRIDTVLMGYRASRQSSTKHSPYYMLFQQQMRLPVDSELLTSGSGELGDEENGEGVAEVIRHLLE